MKVRGVFFRGLFSGKEILPFFDILVLISSNGCVAVSGQSILALVKHAALKVFCRRLFVTDRM
jgi:hypothetical protein